MSASDMDRVEHAADHYAQNGSAECWCDDTTTLKPRRLFVATDGWDMHVWANDPDHPTMPQPVLSQWDVRDAELWNAVVALVESGGVA